MLAAGLEGIEKGYELPDPIEANVYKMTEAERHELGISQLPEDLWEAIQVAEQSELLRKTLGDSVFESLIENKKVEWDRYRLQVTQYELDAYLSVL
jgi:glutamine synthetase